MEYVPARRSERVSAASGALGVVAALTAAPLLLWHSVLADVLSSFHWSLSYLLAELGPWLLLAVGVVFLVPVAVSSGLHPESRFYPRGRRAYFIWGVVLYLLGVLLVVEMYDLWKYAH